MLYLKITAQSYAPETRRALEAADGYVYLGMYKEALAELRGVLPAERGHAAVLVSNIRALLHLKRWKAAETLSAHGARRYEDEEEFTVQRAFALHQMAKGRRSFQGAAGGPGVDPAHRDPALQSGLL